jgi:Taurine catabolism dioxygenase TauD, TfdA family
MFAASHQTMPMKPGDPMSLPVQVPLPQTPFDLDRPDVYARWRDERLARAPTRLADLIVEVADPRRLTATEHAAVLDRCRRSNMAIYAGGAGDDPDKDMVRALGAQFGLCRLDHNMGADEDAITSLKVQSDAAHRDYIPYSNKPIAWHTDGYYNTPEHQIQGLLLHCVQPAASGGANALLDQEIAYILVRDQDPGYIRALMHPRAMTIPANLAEGQVVRPEESGPVFSVTPAGHLHMRYTDRKRNIVWRDDSATIGALACLREVLYRQTPWHIEGRLESGWGLISNNVLHTRTAFEDGPRPRLLYRARYYDRLAGT